MPVHRRSSLSPSCVQLSPSTFATEGMHSSYPSCCLPPVVATQVSRCHKHAPSALVSEQRQQVAARKGRAATIVAHSRAPDRQRSDLRSSPGPGGHLLAVLKFNIDLHTLSRPTERGTPYRLLLQHTSRSEQGCRRRHQEISALQERGNSQERLTLPSEHLRGALDSRTPCHVLRSSPQRGWRPCADVRGSAVRRLHKARGPCTTRE